MNKKMQRLHEKYGPNGVNAKANSKDIKKTQKMMNSYKELESMFFKAINKASATQ